MRKLANVMPLFVVMALWGVHLGGPMQSLQHMRWTVLGHVVPIYYFFTVLPMLGAAVLVFALKREWSRWELFWWLLPLICLPGIFSSADLIWSIRQWLSWTVRGPIPGGILFCAVCDQRRPLLKYWIYPIIIAASLLGLGELYYDHNPLWERRDLYASLDIPQPNSNPFYRPQASYLLNSYAPGPWRLRPAGTQGNRIVYASTLVGFLPLGLWLLKYRRRLYAAHLAAVGILLSILLLSQARSSWTGALAALVLMPALGFRMERRETKKLIVGMLLCLGIFMALPKTRERLWSRINSFHLGEASIHERLQVLRTAKVLKQHWFSGVGFGQFSTACRPYYPGGQIWNGTPDNQYLRWTIENGISSFVLLCAFLIGLVRTGWMKIQRMGDVRQADFYRSILAGWLSVAVTFLFFDGFYWGATNLTFWCMLGLFATCLTAEA